MKMILVMTVGTILVFAIGLALRLGIHKPVRVLEQEEGPFMQIYKHHVGPYYKIVPVIQEVEKWAKDNQVKCELTFGEYQDDPKTVDEDRLQSLGGCIVEAAAATPQLPQDFLYRELPRRRYVEAQFDGAPSIGPYKVYPKALSYLEEKGKKLAGPVMEVYRVTSRFNVETKYLFPIESN